MKSKGVSMRLPWDAARARRRARKTSNTEAWSRKPYTATRSPLGGRCGVAHGRANGGKPDVHGRLEEYATVLEF